MDKGKRTVAYARVIEIAFSEKPEKQSLPSWILERGGIENIRRGPKKSSAASKRLEKIEAKKEYLSQVQAWGAVNLSSDEEVVFNDTLTSPLAAAVVRGRSDGQVELVYSTDNLSALNEVLARVPQQEVQKAKTEMEAARRIVEEEEHQEVLLATKAAVSRVGSSDETDS